MSAGQYTAVPPNEDEKEQQLFERPGTRARFFSITSTLGLLGLAVFSLGLGFGAGWEWANSRRVSQSQAQVVPSKVELLPPQSFIPQSQWFLGIIG